MARKYLVLASADMLAQLGGPTMPADPMPDPQVWPECPNCSVAWVLRRCLSLLNGYVWRWQRDCKHKNAEPVLTGPGMPAGPTKRDVEQAPPLRAKPPAVAAEPSTTNIEAALSNTSDAAVWAEEFLKVVDNGATVDFGLMVGWFANAIETADNARLTAAFLASLDEEDGT